MSCKRMGTILVAIYFLACGIVYSATQPYILSYTTGTTLVLHRITRSDTGIQTTAPVTHNLARTVGATAVDAVLDSSGNLTQVKVYITFVGANQLPGASLLTFNSQLQGPNLVFFSETPLTKLKLGQYQPIRLFQAGAAKRLLGAGPVQTQFSNDYFGYSLDANGVATGAKRALFKNPTGDAIFGGSISPSGVFASQFVLRAVTSFAFNLAARGFALTGGPQTLERDAKFVRLANGNPTQTTYTWHIAEDGGYTPRCTDPVPSAGSSSQKPAANVIYYFDRNFKNGGTPTAQSQIRIMNVDPTTAVPLGAPRPITNFVNAPLFNAETFQSISAAPDGGLVVYTVYSGACKKMILKAQRLTGGQKVGGAKTLLNCNQLTQSGSGVYGINIDSVFIATVSPQP